MKYFLDTEFYDNGESIDLISLAMVAENGRELYLCNQEAKLHLVEPWLRKNVLPKLPPYGSREWKSRSQMRDAIRDFTDADAESNEPAEVWGYYAAYDWVAFCQLFGGMLNLPPVVRRFCRDIKQLAIAEGDARLPEQDSSSKHSALADARWIRDSYLYLTQPHL